MSDEDRDKLRRAILAPDGFVNFTEGPAWHKHRVEDVAWISGGRCADCPPPTGKPLRVTKVDRANGVITVSGE